MLLSPKNSDGVLKNREIVESSVRFGMNSKDSILGLKGQNFTCLGAGNKRMVWYKIANVIIIKRNPSKM